MEIPFEPMKLGRRDEPFDHADWLFQVKWDGVRCIAVTGDRLRLFGRHRRERTGAVPELEGLAAAAGGRRLVLDGELVAFRGGRLSFHGLLERWLAQPPPSPGLLDRIPCVYMIFDLLEQDGKDLIDLPLQKRLQLLQDAVKPSDRWQLVESFPGAGRSLFEAVVAREMEGIVGKHRLSLYRPGMRSDLWVKVKRRQRRLCVVAGYTEGGLILGAYRNADLHFIGRAGSGLTAQHLQLLKEHLESGPMPFARLPDLRSRFAGMPRQVIWVVPRLTVLIEFTEWTEDGKLRDPVVAGFSAEPPDAARLDE
jgi:bifunctional non-homologous end joining protein LigD